MAEFEILDISLVLGADGGAQRLWLSAESSQGSVRAVPVPLPGLVERLGKARRPLVALADGTMPRAVDWLDQSIGQSFADRADGLDVGAMLSDTIFGPQVVRDLYDRARGVAARDGRPLLVRLLCAPNAIAEWPWELLTDPLDPALPLTLSRDVHLIRTPRVRTYPVRAAPIAPPFNLLVVLSSPLPDAASSQRMDSFDLYEAKRHLLAELEPLVASGLLRVEVEDRPTIASLRQRIGRRRQGFHAVHYLGHASQHGLALETRGGRASLVESARFSAILQHNPDLRLVVFSGCRTAQAPVDAQRSPWDWEGELSITHKVVRDAASAVIGMQAVLPFDTERMFTRSFYAALTAGHSIAQALKLARAALWDGAEGRSELLDWAIPTLYCGGSDPGPILDPSVKAQPVELPRRVSLRISPVQKELRFVSRYAQLREAIDILSGRDASKRLVCIRGISGIRADDLSSFIDRAMEELEPGIANLSFSARDLAGSGADGKDTADARITRFIRQIMEQSGFASGPAVASDLDWPVLIEQLSDVPIAIAIDHTDELPPGSPVFDRIRDIVQRRGKVRVVVVNRNESNRFTDGLADLSLTIQLQPLAWAEVWQWIRGQLPRLARLGEDRLAPHYQALGDRLEQWERLTERIDAAGAPPGDALLAQIADGLRREATGAAPADVPLFTANPAAPEAAAPARERAPGPAAAPAPPPAAEGEARNARAGVGPVRIAIAGPYTAGRDGAIVRSMGRFASQYSIAGTVAGGSGADGAAIIVQSLPGGSPFDGKGQSTTAEMLTWFNRIYEAGVDIFVCDFGSSAQNRVLGEVLDAISAQGMLVVAAAGNAGKPSWPAWYDFVLGVGALDAEGKPKPYSPFFPEALKPDIYARASLAGSPIEEWVEDPSMEGTSFSAMAVAADAALVWASYRKLPGDQVGRIICETGARLEGPAAGGGPAPRRVDLDAALDRVQEMVMLDILELGPAGFSRLSAQSGLPSTLAAAAILRLASAGTIERQMRGEEEVYVYPQRILARYVPLAIGAVEAGEQEERFEALFRDARALAARMRWSAADIQQMSLSIEPGVSFLALAAMAVAPEPRFAERALDVVAFPVTAFEAHRAAELLIDLAPGLEAGTKAALAARLAALAPVDPADERGAQLRAKLSAALA